MKLQIVEAFLNNYANFKGRASRREFWQFFLEIMAVSFVSSFVKIFILKFVIGAFLLFLIVPWLAVGVRRLHDIGKSGWYYFVSWIPFIGPIIMLVWACRKGEKGPNRYGPNPLDESLIIA